MLLSGIKGPPSTKEKALGRKVIENQWIKRRKSQMLPIQFSEETVCPQDFMWPTYSILVFSLDTHFDDISLWIYYKPVVLWPKLFLSLCYNLNLTKLHQLNRICLMTQMFCSPLTVTVLVTILQTETEPVMYLTKWKT